MKIYVNGGFAGETISLSLIVAGVENVRYVCTLTVISNSWEETMSDKEEARDQAPSSFDDLMSGSDIDETIATDKTQRLIGKYPIIRKLGQGAMGEVWLGHHPDLDVAVAIKTLPAHLANRDPGYVNRFMREARTAARMNHSNVVRVYDCGVDDDQHFIVMEYVDGCDLKKLQSFHEGAMPTFRSLEIVTSVAEALEEAAAFNVIHRDIKPENIMVDSRDTVKLADLGLAKVKTDTEETGMTQSGATVGSPKYMAPEQVQNSKNVDARADIYSLGATFFHLVTGQAPFHAESSFEMMLKHVEEPLPDPKTINPELPNDVCEVICKMTQKKPEDRYQTAAELVKALKTLLKVHADDASTVINARPSTNSRSTAKLLVVALVVIVGLIAFIVKDKMQTPPTGDAKKIPKIGTPHLIPTERVGEKNGPTPPETGTEHVIPGVDLTMLSVSAGSFRMGRDDGKQSDGPKHSVTLSSNFWMGKYEVTTDQFVVFADATQYRTDAERQGRSMVCEYRLGDVRWELKQEANWRNVHKGGDRPVVCVSWNDAMAFCKWLTKVERDAKRLPKGYECRLPTEAEWEYVCRAGTETNYYWGTESNKVNRYEWFDGLAVRATGVGEFKPNPWGFYDMIGNVSELCLDEATQKGNVITVDTFRDNVIDPLCLVGDKRLGRGCTWLAYTRSISCATRSCVPVRFSSCTVGFRIVLAPMLTNKLSDE